MNPETSPSLVIITASTATYIIIAAIIGMLLSLYCGYRIGKLSKKPKPEANAKPKTYVKEHTFTQEQTLQLAGLWDAMEDGKRLPTVKFWQTLRMMLPKEDLHEALELDSAHHSRWRVKITKDVEPLVPTGNPELAQIAATVAAQMPPGGWTGTPPTETKTG